LINRQKVDNLKLLVYIKGVKNEKSHFLHGIVFIFFYIICLPFFASRACTGTDTRACVHARSGPRANTGAPANSRTCTGSHTGASVYARARNYAYSGPRASASRVPRYGFPVPYYRPHT
jgi:hypothetical protein